jgi:hypothetical protein
MWSQTGFNIPHPLPATHFLYILTQGRGEGERVESERRKGRGATVHKAGSKIAT